MNIIDIILGITLLIGLLRGLWKGFVSEVASLLAVVLGIYGAINFSFILGDYFSKNSDWDKQTVQVLAFTLTLLITMICVGLLGKIVTRFLEASALGLVNRIFGGIFGLLKWAVISGSVLLFFSRTHIPLLSSEIKQESVLYQPVSEVSSLIYSHVFPE